MRCLLLALAVLPVWSQTSDWQAGVAQVSAEGKTPGTGFVVAVRSGRAYVVTCAHVVAGDPKPVVTFRADPEERYSAVVRDIQGTRTEDLALLVVEKAPAGVRALEAAANASVTGTPVAVAGYPASVGAFTVLPSTIVSIRGSVLYLSPDTDEGFSGGPVVLNGRVVGMVFGHGQYGRGVPAAILDVYLRGLDVRWGSDASKPAEPKVELGSGPKPSEPAPGTVRENAKDGLRYVWIPAGKFTMGCSPGDAECFDDEKPPHEVEITRGFWMGQTEVTQAAYQTVMKTNPSYFKGVDRPVENVSWDHAKAYCEAVGMRLPTEAEWEYAARAGSTEGRYGKIDQIAWYDSNSKAQTHPVAAKSRNAWGLYDLLGNVWEWTADWYDKDYYSQKVLKDPQGPASSPENRRVVRGGAWNFGPRYGRVSVRDGVGPTNRFYVIGFRCAGELR